MASLVFLAFDVPASLVWWNNPEITKTVSLDASAQQPQAISCDATGVWLALSMPNGDVAALYGLSGLVRRKDSVLTVGGDAVPHLDIADGYRVGGRFLRYYGKADGKVYVAADDSETALVDLSGADSSILHVRVASSMTEEPFLHVLLAQGIIRVYGLSADGLSLADTIPVATVDVGALLDGDGVSCFDVSPDGIALFAVPEQGDTIRVIRSSDWGLVDCVAPAARFPWHSDVSQTTSHNSTTMSGMTIPASSETFEPPFIWPWADPEIYKRIGYRNGNLTSTFSNLTVGNDYRAEYHCAENWFTAVGQRVYSLTINDVMKYENMDPYLVAGNARWKAFALAYDVTPTPSGQIVFSLIKVTDQPIYSGFAVWGREKPSGVVFEPTFEADGSTGTLTWNAKDTLAYYVQSAPSREGPWTTILLDQSAKTLAVSPGLSESVYYRVVASNGVGTVTSAVYCNKREKYTVYAINCGYDLKRYGRFAPHDHSEGAVCPSRDANLPGVTTTFFAENADPVPVQIAETALFHENRTVPFSYRFPHLRADRTYDVRVYCQETYFNSAGKRVFSIGVNGETVCAGVDAFALTGVKNCVAEVVIAGVSPKSDGTLELSFTPEKDYVDLSAIELVENDSPCVPLVPVVHGAYARNNGVQISIGSGTSELTYDIRRRPVSGGEYEILMTGLSDYAWIDAGVTSGYVYSVRAVDGSGAAGEWSGDVAVTPMGEGPQSFIGISPQRNFSFTNQNGVYVPYTHYLRISTDLNEDAQLYSHEIVLDPAPEPLYSRILWRGSAELTFTNLYPSANYRLRLQAIESYYAAAGKRVTSGVYANDTQIYGGFDAYREVGKGVFPIEAVVKSTPDGRIDFFTRQARDNIDLATVELFLLDGASESGVARAIRSETVKGTVWMQDCVQTLDLEGMPEGVPATGNECIWDTMLSVPADGNYTFEVEQGGAYALWIDDEVTLEVRDGATGSGTVTLAMGDHHLRARYVQGTGASNVSVKWSGPGFARQGIAMSSFTRSRTVDLSQDQWLTAEIGTAHTGDFYKIGQQTGDGSEIWRMTSSALGFYGRNDRSHFIYREVTSLAFEARVRLRNIPDRSRDSTFGLTLRTELTPFGGDYVRQMISGVTTPGAGTRWHTGPQGADFSVESPYINNAVDWDLKLPIWQRVRKWRAEDGKDYAEFAYSLDVDAASWKVCCTNELTSTRPILVGVEACSYTEERLVSFEFDHFELDIPPPLGTIILIR
ncbi:MAG: hypothetical protein J6336_13615 [Kiritimatiellae bacterium]|nr:hypothetical protein [Kiritimatiellia bacterium]